VLKIRGSSADCAMECAGSLLETATPYNENTDEARAGTAKHEALADMVRGEEPPIDTIAERHQVDVDELARAVVYGRQAWAEIGRWFPDPHAEVRLDGEVSQGTADVLSLVPWRRSTIPPESMALADWKTGWGHDEHRYQLMAYADAARAEFGMPTSGYITAIEVWLQHRETITRNFTWDELEGFRKRAKRQIEQVGKQYSAGLHCKFCPRRNQCPARDEYLRASVVALVPAGDEPRALTREVLGSLYERSTMLGRALRNFDALLDDALADGPVPLGNGKMLALVSKQQDEIDATKALPLLADSDLTSALSVSKAAIEREIKARVAHGGAASEMRRVLGALRELDAINQVEKKTKTVVDAKETV
jgi:Protein of unknown function (DUF2800)